MHEKSTLHTQREKKNKSVTTGSTTRRDREHQTHKTNKISIPGAVTKKPTNNTTSKVSSKGKKKVIVSHNNSKQPHRIEYPISSSKDNMIYEP
jgi:hypothetical protein